MRKTMVAVVAICLLATIDAAAKYKDTVNESYRVGPGGLLTVETSRGSIQITTNTRDRVEVEITREVDAPSRKQADRILDDLELDLSQDGDNVTVKARYDRKRDSWLEFGNKLKLRFVISVPERYNVQLSTAGGSISVTDLQGEVHSRTSGGSLSFGNIDGPVIGRTSGGSIELAGCIGGADVSTSGGGIRIGEVDGNVRAVTSGGSITIERSRGNVIAKTSGGSIRVDEVMGALEAKTSGGSIKARITEQPAEDCVLSTSGGSVEVAMAKGIGVELEARTSAGSVYSDFQVQGSKATHRRQTLNGSINGGGPALILHTSAGNISLKEMSL